MKKKIFFILPGLTFGGAERVILTLLNYLDDQKYELTLILFKNLDFPTNQLNNKVNIIELGIERIRLSVFKIFPIILQQKPDIVFCGWGEIAAFLSPFIPFFRHTKFISRETNIVSQHVTRKEIRFFYNFYNNFHKIITQSDDMTIDLLYNFGIKKEKIFKINNPVDFDFINEKLALSEIPKDFDKDFKNVVAIGNLSSRKGFDNLLQVFSHLKNDKIKLHILGDGRDKDLLYQMKNDLGLGNVIFHGKQKNPYQFLKFADLFILSSRYEGFPNVLLEAGACGIYALANNCKGGITEIVQPKINGEIEDITNFPLFAQRIKSILEENHNKEQIIDSIHSRFSKEIILRRYEDFFDKK